MLSSIYFLIFSHYLNELQVASFVIKAYQGNFDLLCLCMDTFLALFENNLNNYYKNMAII